MEIKMEHVFVDTCILVDFLKGKIEAISLLKNLLDKNKLFISVLTLIELKSGVRQNELESMDKLLNLFEKVEVDEKISELSSLYVQRFNKNNSLTIADAIIAASVRKVSANLLTLNVERFPMNDINIVKPY